MSFFRFNLETIYNRFVLNFSDSINVSFEFFPPRNHTMESMFWESIRKLSTLDPVFISITYGVRSGTRDYIYSIIKKIKDCTGLVVAPHLTCVNSTLKELKVIAERYWNNGIRHVVALRGDNLNKEAKSSVMYAIDLVVLLKQIGDFDIAVAAYPEVHPEAVSAKSDLINLKRKIDAGANRAITQFFFDTEKYLRFRDLCVSFGISIPIIPGIFPIFDFCQLKHFVSFTQVGLPQWILSMFNDLDSDLQTQKMVGIVIAMEMIKILIREGVRDFHFYTLNRFELTYAICCMLGLRSKK